MSNTNDTTPPALFEHISQLAKGTPSVRRSTGEFLGTQWNLPSVEVEGTLHMWFQELPPGVRSSPIHNHTHCLEGVVVLEGRLRVLGAHNERVLEPGTVAMFPPQSAPHGVVCHGEETARFLGLAVRNEEDSVVFAEE